MVLQALRLALIYFFYFFILFIYFLLVSVRFDTNQSVQIQWLARALAFEYRNKRYHYALTVNNEAADQSAQIRRLIGVFIVRLKPACRDVPWCGFNGSNDKVITCGGIFRK